MQGLSLINIISDKFDPEILTYLNDSLREEIVETLDIKQLATNAKELDIDDAVDLVEDLEEKEQLLETIQKFAEMKEQKVCDLLTEVSTIL